VPIEFKCKHCQQMLRVKDTDAGKQARCPSCQAVVPVPAKSLLDQGDPQAQWHVRTSDQATYGPISKLELDSWVAEGRLNADSQIRRDGDSQWQNADVIYPILSGTRPNTSANPFSDTASTASGNPYASPQAGGLPTSIGGARHYTQPHRGGLILALGIIGFMTGACTCLIPGICAWYMGNDDLHAMRTGRMDPNGHGLTMAGMILGIVATILNGLWIFLGVIGALLN